MDISYAKDLLKSLADGVNPLTGEVLPYNDSCNQPDIIRALHVAVAHLEKAAKKEKSLPANAGKSWSPEDDEKLIQMFDEGIPQSDICNHFKRTTGAIAARLVRLGKIQARDEFRYG